MTTIPIKRALLSVSDKYQVIDFAKKLVELGVEIISTGGTGQVLSNADIPYVPIETITGFPEILNGRVKTLHPKIHGGILGRRDQDIKEAEQLGIRWIDLVVVNFYPFTQAAHSGLETAIEHIDIGGPTMVRAAAKNCAWVGVVVDPNDYESIASEIAQEAGLSWKTRKALAAKAFALTSDYDADICDYFSEPLETPDQPNKLKLILDKHSELRYGENPHQKAYAYSFRQKTTGLLSACQYQGKPLSYNNIVDAEAACSCVDEFDAPTCVIVKHANPCGVASAPEIDQAYLAAYQADPVSAFGGIVALNRTCTKALAEAMLPIFTEVIIAPEYTPEALSLLSTKPNLRVLEMPNIHQEEWEIKHINGGLLLQEKDSHELTVEDLEIVTAKTPSQEALSSMLFAWRVIKHVKSNAIVIAHHHSTVGIGAGQVSRIDAVNIALQKAQDKIAGSVLASDAFFPFRDSIDRIKGLGIEAIIQPGGSVRDNEVIAACNEYGIAMAFTHKRCFKH